MTAWSSSNNGSREHYEVVVVGGGQAGLAMGHFLAREGHRFVLLERSADVGPAWRERWDSLTLFTPRRYSALPGLPLPGDPDGYPTRNEVIAYLRRYAETLELPIELNSEVQKLEASDGSFILELNDRTIAALVTVPAVCRIPYETACSVFIPRSTSSLTRLRMNTW